MLFIDKNISKNIFILTLTVFHIIYFFSIFLVDGYPQNNDILHIFKITSLEGNLKFINGLYGPGYAYYSLIFSNSITVLSFFLSFLSILSSILINLLLSNYTKNLAKNEKFTLYLFSLLFHLIIILSLGFNHSESVFLLLFYNGALVFIFGYYIKDKNLIYIFGLLLLGVSILFRQHGIIALFFLFIFFLFFEIYHCKKNIFLFSREYFIIGILLLCPILLSLIHLYSIDAIRMWQTSFRLHMITYVHDWGDWRDLKYLIKSEDIKNFNIFEADLNHLLNILRNFTFAALKQVYPFIFCFLIAFAASKKKIVLISLCLFLMFIFMILPGFHKGYFPGVILCFISILICFREISQKKIASFFVFIFLFGHLFYLSENYTENVNERYRINNDIKKNIVPFLKNKQIRYRNIFADDLNFYSSQIDGERVKLCNWGGWLLLHPYLDSYYPRDVILGKKNKYCDIKVLITPDKNIAEKYVLEQNISLAFKTNLHYVLIVN